MYLGNDLVHWSGDTAGEKEVENRTTRRFFDRILHESENALLVVLGKTGNRLATISLPRFQALWMLWAAKEAVFKAAMKATPGLVFSPRAIPVRITRSVDDFDRWWPLRRDTGFSSPTVPLAHGWTRVQDRFYDILWEYGQGFVHALALGPRAGRSVGPPWARVIHGVESDDILLQEPCDVLERASRAARYLARRLAGSVSSIGDRAMTLQIVRTVASTGRLSPPRIYSATEPLNMDLTMSHDGPWIAAGLFLHEEFSSPSFP